MSGDNTDKKISPKLFPDGTTAGLKFFLEKFILKTDVIKAEELILEKEMHRLVVEEKTKKIKGIIDDFE